MKGLPALPILSTTTVDIVTICQHPHLWPCCRRNNICPWIISGDCILCINCYPPGGDHKTQYWLLVRWSIHITGSIIRSHDTSLGSCPHCVIMFLVSVSSKFSCLISELVSLVLRWRRGFRPDLNTLYRVFNEQNLSSCIMWGLRRKETCLLEKKKKRKHNLSIALL